MDHFSKTASCHHCQWEPAQSLHLLYHELRPERSAYLYALDLPTFAEHMALLARLRNGGGWLRPEVTFDDGHLSDRTLALPILQQHGIPATFFITAGWTGTRAGFMDWPELRQLHAAGQRIGAHGMTHTLLTHCTPAELASELEGSRKRLEDGLGTEIRSMSLPGGRYNARVLQACRAAGYQHVYTSEPRAMAAGPVGSAPAQPLIGRLNIRAGVSTAWLEQVLDPESPVLRGLTRQYRLKETARTLLGDRLYARLWAMLNRHEGEAEAA